MSRMTSVFLLAGVLIPAMTSATTYHVRPSSGSDSNNGLTYTTAFKTITRVNALMQSGDNCYLWPGAHTGVPNPSSSSSGGRRYTFIGAGINGENPLLDTLSRASILVPGGSISKPYVTLKGVTVTSGLTLTEGADRDSILNITCNGSWSNQGADYTVYANCKYKGPSWNLNKGTLGSSDGVQLYWNDFPYLGQNAAGAGDHIHLTWDADSTVLMFNRFLITVESGLDGSLGAEWHFGDRNHVSRGNYTGIQLNRSCYAVWRWRSNSGWGDDKGCYNLKFDNDVLRVTGAGGKLLPSSSANCGVGAYLSQCVGAWNASIDSCVIDGSGTSGATDFYFQGGMHGWRITNSVIAMNGSAINAFDMKDANVISNCTLSGNSTIQWTNEYGRGPWSPGAVAFTNNIVTAWSGSTMSFAAILSVTGAFTADYNVYWKGSGSIPKLLGSDLHSRYGDPLFVNGSKGSAYDPHLRQGSPAIDLVPPGNDAGAYQYGAVTPDVTPPAPVVDLR